MEDKSKDKIIKHSQGVAHHASKTELPYQRIKVQILKLILLSGYIVVPFNKTIKTDSL